MFHFNIRLTHIAEISLLESIVTAKNENPNRYSGGSELCWFWISKLLVF